MDLSVVIPTYNRKEVLLRTLPTLFKQSISPDRFELIVVVDGSTDGTAQAIRELNAPVRIHKIEIPHLGISAARNAGIREASGKYLLFLDDDILASPELLEVHLSAHQRGSATVTFGRNIHSSAGDNLEQDWSAAADQQMEESFFGSGAQWPVHATLDANCCLERSKIIEVGLYDENLHARENLDMGLRLWKKYGPFEFLPAARGLHLYTKSASTLVAVDGPRAGSEELEICRRYPEFRPHSALATLGEGGRSHRALREALVRLPFSAEPLFAIAFWLCQRLRRLSWFRRMGLRLLRIRSANSFFRSATKAAGGWGHLEAAFGRRLPVLLYHNIGPPQSADHAELTVSPAKFDRQLDWIQRFGYTPITCRAWLDWLRSGTPLPRRPVLITFDDASKHLTSHAFPSLEKNRFAACVFAVTGWLGGNMPWDGGAVMTADDLREWKQRGIEIGGHTRTHVALSNTSLPECETEIAGCRSDLEELLGALPLSFAYPYGIYDQGSMAIAARNFAMSFTTSEGLNHLRTPLPELKRTIVQPGDSFLALFCRLRLGFNPMQRLRAFAKIRTRLKGLVSPAR